MSPDAIHFCAYTTALWGGETHKWLLAHDLRFRMDQMDPGPAYLVVQADRSKPVLVNVGDWIVKTEEGVAVFSHEDYWGKEE